MGDGEGLKIGEAQSQSLLHKNVGEREGEETAPVLSAEVRH